MYFTELSGKAPLTNFNAHVLFIFYLFALDQTKWLVFRLTLVYLVIGSLFTSSQRIDLIASSHALQRRSSSFFRLFFFTFHFLISESTQCYWQFTAPPLCFSKPNNINQHNIFTYTHGGRFNAVVLVARNVLIEEICRINQRFLRIVQLACPTTTSVAIKHVAGVNKMWKSQCWWQVDACLSYYVTSLLRFMKDSGKYFWFDKICDKTKDGILACWNAN